MFCKWLCNYINLQALTFIAQVHRLQCCDIVYMSTGIAEILFPIRYLSLVEGSDSESMLQSAEQQRVSELPAGFIDGVVLVTFSCTMFSIRYLQH